VRGATVAVRDATVAVRDGQRFFDALRELNVMPMLQLRDNFVRCVD
jgi:hypothetical protein